MSATSDLGSATTRDQVDLHHYVLTWYNANARDLPWRRPWVSAWGVLVSEFMLQQTPVSRVEKVWQPWLDRWPTPASHAADSPAEAIRQWGKLGYPRRALRLHAAAQACVERHEGEVPSEVEQLLDLPGVGSYTAAAVASFAFRQRAVVLDTNVRRVLGRVLNGQQFPTPHQTKTEVAQATDLVPRDAEMAATWAVAVMELGALVCTAAQPKCNACPLQERCTWRRLGYPDYDGPTRRAQSFVGTDRQVRGLLLDVLRKSPAAVSKGRLDLVWRDGQQRERALDGLVADGLIEPTGTDAEPTFALPARAATSNSRSKAAPEQAASGAEPIKR